ncbi:SpdD protein [Streptomyces sp. NPDC051452]|uniref:SpdD protein n=1 Tax=Streptomyces sp. NPDC051452 TaxID=3365654 RepID=UPI00379B9BFC
MLTPKYPRQHTAPPPAGIPSQPAPVLADSPAPAPAPVSNRPTIHLTPGTALALVGGGTAVVLVVGAVLVSLLLAVAITGVSVAVTAVVLRSLVNNQKGH